MHGHDAHGYAHDADMGILGEKVCSRVRVQRLSYSGTKCEMGNYSLFDRLKIPDR